MGSSAYRRILLIVLECLIFAECSERFAIQANKHRLIRSAGLRPVLVQLEIENFSALTTISMLLAYRFHATEEISIG
jgi:hypothetical protein